MTMALALRRARAEDAAAVHALSRAAYGRWVPLIGREPKPMTADYGKAVREHVVFLHEGAEGLLGVLELIPAMDHVLVENVAVSPAAQGRGLGRALMAHAETVARALGLTEMRLYTNEKFVENIRLYELLGYAIYDRTPVSTSVAVWMRKRLGAPTS